jgi:hypothetical protein
MFNKAPKAEAPKGGDDFIHFPSFPESDTVVGTLVAYNFIKDFKTKNKEGQDLVYDAVELIYGAKTADEQVYFLKTYPMKYSVSEKAKYAKYCKAATGEWPEAGTTPDDFVGKPVLLTVKVEEKVSKKGKKYTASRLEGVTAVPKALKGNAPDAKVLLPQLEELVNKLQADQNNPDQPF